MEERQKQIFDLVQQLGKVSVDQLAKTFYVSPMTIRRDLAELELIGMIKRYRGGAVSKIEDGELPITQRALLGEAEKRELGKKAECFLSNGLSVFLDSSSTCSYIIPFLKKYTEIQLITNSVKSLLYAAEYHIPALLLGGNYSEQDMCLTGAMTNQAAEEINVDIAFFSTQSFSDDGVISDSSQAQIEVRKYVMKNAKKSVFLFESSKLHKKSLHTLCSEADVFAVLLPDSAEGQNKSEIQKNTA